MEKEISENKRKLIVSYLMIIVKKIWNLYYKNNSCQEGNDN